MSGRSGLPNSRQRFKESNCIQRNPAALPFGMPGMDEEIDSAMQHAPQPIRQSMGIVLVGRVQRHFCAQFGVERVGFGPHAMPDRKRFGGLLDQHA